MLPTRKSRRAGENFLGVPSEHMQLRDAPRRVILTGYMAYRLRYVSRMRIDALSRRIRSASPAPRVARLIVTEADIVLFQALERQGPLPSHYLYEYTKHLRRDRTHLQNRLTEFYNGDARGAFLTRPPQQFASYRGRYQHVVYDLAPRAHRLLSEHALVETRVRADPFVHRLMTACVGASFELTAPGLGLRFIGTAEILAHPSCRATRERANALELPASRPGLATIVPDLLFGIEYPGSGFRFFAAEIDRNTESIERRNLRQNAFARKVEAFAGALDAGTYRSWWGVPNLHILIVTTNRTHARRLLEHIAAHVPAHHQGRFAIAVETEFGADWNVPGTVLCHLLNDPWMTTVGPKAFATA